MREQWAAVSTPAVSALQSALAAEHAAVYGYGVAGAHLAGPQQNAATRAWDAHRAMRDTLIAMVSARGAAPVAAADAYKLPFAVHAAHVAASLALELEEGVMRAYLGLVAVPDASLRVFGAQALQAAALRAAAWRGGPVAFPGLPRSALASAAPPRGKPGNAR